MRDPRFDKLAEVVVQYCASVGAGDLVTIVGEPDLTEGIEAMFEAVLRAGGFPSFHPRSESLQQLLVCRGSDDQIRHVCPFEEHRLANCDVLIVLRSSSNTRFLGGIDPIKAAMMQAARRGLQSMSMKRAAAGTMRYVLTECPSNGAAQDAEMSLAQYADLVFRAGFLHLPDPVQAWRTLHAKQEKVLAFLQTKHTLRFRAPASDGTNGGRRHEGTDLTVDVSGRTWVNCAGGQNFPDGEVFTGPRSVDGVMNITHPSVYKGGEVDGVRLFFKDGRVTDASASRNEAFLIDLLDQDEGARNAGEIAIGTNYELHEFMRNAFFDEKIGGTFHLALGAGYPETGNTNESGLHWDFVSDLRPGGAFPGSSGGTIEADGEIIHKDGKFLQSGWPGS
ncbi:MAG: aminopeptidase [Phycisphaeraceae bacterium]|nr:aminopeptidase [Phycisphaeraceae bacterium]